MQKRSLLFFLLILFIGSFGFFHATQAESGILYFSPAAGIFTEGETFEVEIWVDTKGENVNAIAAYFSYPEDKLEALGVSREGSAMTLFAEETAGGGKVSISGGKATPGISGIQKVASVSFRAKTAGTAILLFTSDSAVLEDSDNQNILDLGLSASAVYTIQSSSVPSSVSEPPSVLQPSLLDPLLLFGIAIDKATENDVVVAWTTNRNADSRIDYGSTGNYAFSVVDGELTSDHRIVISGIQSLTDKQFRVSSTDVSGETVRSGNLAFIDFLSDEEREEIIQKTEIEAGSEADESEESGGLRFQLSPLVLFVLVPFFVLLIIAFLLVRRARR